MENTNNLKDLALTYFEGNATTAQKKELSTLMGTPEGKLEFQRLRDEWNKTHRALGEEDEPDFNSLLYKIVNVKSGQAGMKGWIIGSLCTAAVAAVLIAFGIFSPASSTGNQMFRLSTKPGNSLLADLPDGSTVSLAGSSSLSYSSAFSPENREIELDGDAFFNITTDPEHPFTVNLADCSITVKGTKFRASAEKGSGKVEAVLIEGKIDMTTPVGRVELSPGTSICYDSADGSLKRAPVPADDYLALMEGRLNYRNVTISELCDKISRLYNRTIRLDDKLSDSQTIYTLSLSNRESFEDVISVISVMTSVNIYETHDGVWLSSK